MVFSKIGRPLCSLGVGSNSRKRRHLDTLRIAERNAGAAMEGQFAIDSAAAGADTEKYAGQANG